MPDSMIAVVVPTYNEAGNLRELADRIFALDLPNLKLLIVDDGSTDGTEDIVVELIQIYKGNVEVIQRGRKLGLGTAYIAGFSRVLAEGADYVFQMDADLSHAPEYLPEFLNQLGDADVVVGSRYVKDGGVDKTWNWFRRLVSSGGNLGIRTIAGLRVKDATSGFKVFKASVLRSLNLDQFECKGFAFQAEVAYVCQRMGFQMTEHPIIFTDRSRGRSKMSMSIVIEAVWRLLLLRWKRGI